MIRPIMAVLIAVAIILFVWQYSAFTDRIRPEPLQIVETDATGRYDVKVVCTFDCQGNQFGSPAVKIQFRGRDLVLRPDRVESGEMILVERVPDIKQGLNDFHVLVTPVESDESNGGNAGGAFSLDPDATDTNSSSGARSIARAVRVEVLQDGHVIASDLIWSNDTGPFGDLVKIEVGDSAHQASHH